MDVKEVWGLHEFLEVKQLHTGQNSMIGYIMVESNDLDRAIKFYDELFKILDLERIETDDVCAGYSQKGNSGKVEFYVTKPVNKKEATIGNGSQVSFITNSEIL